MAQRLVDIDPRYAWSEVQRGSLIAAYKGRTATVRELLSLLPAQGLPDLKLLARPLAALSGHFVVLVQGEGWILAMADKVAGYPGYYVHKDGKFQASNSARLLQRNWGLTAGHADALLELRTAGYVTGRETLVRHLYKLQAGEVVLWDAAAASITRQRYYLFYSQEVLSAPENDLIDELDGRTNVIIDRLIEDADDRQVVVPLSGGLDSRVILTKLKMRGCRNIWTFSYGVPGNYEAKVARYVAEVLGVPWSFVPTTNDEAKAYFYSADRQDYWEYADGLHVVPNLHAMFALRRLQEEGRFLDGAVLVNGQSGDFIAGDHIPTLGRDTAIGFDLLHGKIMSKHYSLRRGMLEDPDVVGQIRGRIDAAFEVSQEMSTPQEYAKIHELWEWQGRQAVRVINGQRNYDYFDLAWELPLWEQEYLEFWARIPLVHKLGRTLFRRWLEREDFYGLFRDYQPFLSRWPRHLVLIQHLGRAMRLLVGVKASRRYYELLDYYSQYSYLYGQLTYAEYLHHCSDYKGPISYYVDAWEQENQGLFTEGFV